MCGKTSEADNGAASHDAVVGSVMTQASHASLEKDSKTGRIVTVRGVGALRGRLHLDPRIDLLKPISRQAAELG